jgi:hypothetical protein
MSSAMRQKNQFERIYGKEYMPINRWSSIVRRALMSSPINAQNQMPQKFIDQKNQNIANISRFVFVSLFFFIYIFLKKNKRKQGKKMDAREYIQMNGFLFNIAVL